MTDTAELIARLRGKSMRVHDLSGVGWVDDPDCIAAADAIASLVRERDEARELVTEANNSLYGSQGYFHSLNGEPFDKYHLATGIEKLKSEANRQYHALEAAEARTAAAEANAARMRKALEPFANAYREHDDPGVSDLDNEQPVAWHVPLGAYRIASSLSRARASLSNTSEGDNGE